MSLNCIWARLWAREWLDDFCCWLWSPVLSHYGVGAHASACARSDWGKCFWNRILLSFDRLSEDNHFWAHVLCLCYTLCFFSCLISLPLYIRGITWISYSHWETSWVLGAYPTLFHTLWVYELISSSPKPMWYVSLWSLPLRKARTEKDSAIMPVSLHLGFYLVNQGFNYFYFLFCLGLLCRLFNWCITQGPQPSLGRPFSSLS